MIVYICFIYVADISIGLPISTTIEAIHGNSGTFGYIDNRTTRYTCSETTTINTTVLTTNLATYQINYSCSNNA